MARNILKERFGTPQQIAISTMGMLKRKEKVDSPAKMQELSDKVKNALKVLSNVGGFDDMTKMSS